MIRGQIWLADFPEPIGSEPAYERPVIVVQHDEANTSKLNTTIVVPLTSSVRSHEGKRWTVLIDSRRSGLRRDSIALLYQVTAVDRSRLLERIGQLPEELMQAVDLGLLRTLGLED